MEMKMKMAVSLINVFAHRLTIFHIYLREENLNYYYCPIDCSITLTAIGLPVMSPDCPPTHPALVQR